MRQKHGDPFGGVYKGARVLVTGHTGFKGSWLALWLSELGASVSGYSLPPPTNPSLFESAHIMDMMDHNTGDVRDFITLKALVDSFKPRIVFHLAAQALVRPSYASPKETFDTNVGGAVNILEAARLSGSVESLVIITSDKCYENQAPKGGYVEDDRLGGADPYSASKGMAELAVASYKRSFFLPLKESLGASMPGIASARAGNVIGGGDFGQDRLVPDSIRAFQDNKPLVIRNPQSKRPWQFVLAPLSGYLQLGAKLITDKNEFSGPWNFGPNVEDCLPVQNLVEKLIEHWGGGTVKIPEQDNRYPEATTLLLNWDKAAHKLGWRPVYSLDKALKETVQGYRAFDESSQTLRDLCIKQIREYTAEAVSENCSWSKE